MVDRRSPRKGHSKRSKHRRLGDRYSVGSTQRSTRLTTVKYLILGSHLKVTGVLFSIYGMYSGHVRPGPAVRRRREQSGVGVLERSAGLIVGGVWRYGAPEHDHRV